jgi:hypothetical protein
MSYFLIKEGTDCYGEDTYYVSISESSGTLQVPDHINPYNWTQAERREFVKYIDYTP